MINLKIKIMVFVVCALVLSFRDVMASQVANQEIQYVKISKQEYELLKKQSFLNGSILQRLRDLETLYKQVKEIIDSFSSTIKLIKDILNIGDDDIAQDVEDPVFEHFSGVILYPGFVKYKANTYDKKSSFQSLGIETLEMDVYYNKKLFTIDHIEGDQVFGEEFKRISLPSNTSSSKDRIELPLSDVLSSEATFKIYFAPLNPTTIRVGDKTLVDLKYYKRPIYDLGGVAMPAIVYSRETNSTNYIQIKTK
ncbi:MAG: hypothetical protein RLZZ361_125 [Cyanobacteriota bacterium]|jgi:hypothetical protein